MNLGWNAIQNSEDPAIIAARELVSLIRENKKIGEELDAKEEVLSTELGLAFYEAYGIKVRVHL